MMGVLENMARLEKLEAQGQPTPIWNSEPRPRDLWCATTASRRVTM